MLADALSEFSRSMIVGFAGITAGEAFETETATPDTFCGWLRIARGKMTFVRFLCLHTFSDSSGGQVKVSFFRAEAEAIFTMVKSWWRSASRVVCNGSHIGKVCIATDCMSAIDVGSGEVGQAPGPQGSRQRFNMSFRK